MNDDDLQALKAWAEKVTEGQRDAAVFLSLWNDSMLTPSKEPIAVFQLGYAMVLDKPIVLIVPRGSRVPRNVERAAQVIEYYDRDDKQSLKDATMRALQQMSDMAVVRAQVLWSSRGKASE